MFIVVLISVKCMMLHSTASATSPWVSVLRHRFPTLVFSAQILIGLLFPMVHLLHLITSVNTGSVIRRGAMCHNSVPRSSWEGNRKAVSRHDCLYRRCRTNGGLWCRGALRLFLPSQLNNFSSKLSNYSTREWLVT